MKNIGIEFTLMEEGQKVPPDWTKASGHIIFDVNMDLTRKSRWGKDVHHTNDPTTST